MSSQWGPVEVMGYLKKSYPNFRFFLTHQKEKTLLTRFACNKIVQNLIKKKDKYHLVVVSPELKVLQRSLNQLPDGVEGVRRWVEDLVGQVQFFPALNYSPSLVISEGHWGKGEFQGDLPAGPMTQIVGDLLKTGQEKNMDNLAGFFQNERLQTTLLTSEGGNLVNESCVYQIEMSGFRKGYEVTSADFQKSWQDLHPHMATLQIEEWLDLPTTTISPGSYRVVLSAQSVANLLAYAIYTDNFNALSIREETSPMGKYLGNPENAWVSDKVTLVDNPDPKKILFSPFDSVGHIRQSHALVENGFFKNPLFNEREAQLQNAGYFGHCLGIRDSGAYPYDLQMKGSEKSLRSLWEEMDDGYYLHDLHYLSVAERLKFSIFGLTRGGVLEIRGGKPVRKVQNMRFEISLTELFSQIEDLGQESECRIWQGSITAPAILVKGFHLTEAATNI